MRYFRPKNFVIVAILFTAGCGDDGQSGPPVPNAVESVSIDLTANHRQCQVDDEPSVSLGLEDGERPYLLFRAFGATRLSDGRIVISNQGSYELRFFSPEGEFLFATGSQGDAPGEFNNASTVWALPGDTVWAADHRPWEYEVFDADGNWIRGVRPVPEYPNPPEETALLSDGSSLIAGSKYRPSEGFEQTDLSIMLHDPSGNLVDTLLTIPHKTRRMSARDGFVEVESPYFDSRGHIAGHDDLLATGHGGEPTIRLYGVSGGLELIRAIHLEGQSLDVDQSLLRTWQDEVRERNSHLDATTRENYLERMFDEGRPMAGQLPAMADLMWSTDGALLVELFRRPGESEYSEWVRLSAEGEYQCHISIPKSLDVFEFGPDYILLKEGNPGVVERVHLYRYESS